MKAQYLRSINIGPVRFKTLTQLSVLVGDLVTDWLAGSSYDSSVQKELCESQQPVGYEAAGSDGKLGMCSPCVRQSYRTCDRINECI